MDDIVCYLSQPDDEQVVRFYLLSHLRTRVLEQYKKNNSYVSTENTS